MCLRTPLSKLALASAGLVLLLGMGAGCRQNPYPSLEELRATAGRQADTPEAWIVLGDAYLKQERFNEAFMAYKRAATLDPKSLPALLGLAEVSRRLSDPDSGLEYVRQALERKPQDPAAIGARGRLRLAKGDAAGALPDLKYALKASPEQFETQLSLISAYTVQKQPQLALQQAQAALQLFHDDARMHYVYATLLEADDQAAATEQEYRLAMHYDPNLVRAKFRLATLLVKLRQKLPEARTLALEVSNQDRGDGTAQGLASWALYLQGKREAALQELQGVWQENPDNVWVLLRLHQAGREMGNKQVEETAANFLRQILGPVAEKMSKEQAAPAPPPQR